MKGVVDVDTSLNAGKPEVSVRVDRPKAADLGVQIADAAEALRLLVGGDQVTTYNEGGEQYEVHLRAQAANRSTQEAVASLTVPSARLGTVSLDNVATFSRGSAPSDINRLRRQRQVTVFANLLPGGSQAEVQNAMEAEFKNLNAGPEYRGGLTGRSRELGRAAQNFILAFAAVADLHVSDSGRAVRVVAASGHDPAVAAADAALRAAVDHHLPAVVEHLLGAGAAGAVRRRQEELDSADRPRQPAQGEGPDRRTTPSCRPAATGCGPS